MRTVTLLAIVASAVPRAWAEPPLGPADLELRPALTDGRLALFPVVLVSPRAPVGRLILLDEGLAAGRVTITEIGSPDGEEARQAPGQDPPAQPRREVQQTQQHEQVQRADPGAQVNKLAVRNDSDLPLLLLAGEMIRGARQDRIIAHDVIIPPHSATSDLDVFCVESGRWTEESAEFRSAPAVGAAAVRSAAQMEKSQAAVWDKVAKYNEAVGARSTTENLNAAYEKPEVRAAIEASAGRLDALLAAIPGCAGAVAAVGDRLLAIDLFASAELWSRLRRKLLAGYLLDALSAQPSGGEPPALSAARAFLDAALTAPRTPDWSRGELSIDGFEDASARGTLSSWRGTELHLNAYAGAPR